MSGADQLGAAMARVMGRQGGGMDLTSLLPDRMLIEASAGHRLRMALSNVSEGAYAAATKAMAEGGGHGGCGYSVSGGVGVLCVTGVLMKRPDIRAMLSGGKVAFTEQLLASFRGALADEAAKVVLVVVDSPGGDVAGIDELADAIYAARAVKPIVALGADECCSGGYWLACQASRFYVTSNASVGSIGVRLESASYDRLAKNIGIDTRTFASTPAKASLPDAAIQQIVDDLAHNFTAAVARGRGIEFPAAEALADALLYTGQRAVDRGLADGVMTEQSLLAQLQAEVGAMQQTPSAAEPPKEETMDEETKARLDALESKVDALDVRVTALESKVEDTAEKAPTEEEPESLAALRAEVTALRATVTSDRDADRLVAELRGEHGGPVRLAAADADGEAIVRKRVAEKGVGDARAHFTGTLAVLGKGSGTVATPGTGTVVARPDHRFDAIGRAKWAASSDPVMQAYGRKIEWIDATEKAGRKFRNAAEAFAAYDAAHKKSAA